MRWFVQTEWRVRDLDMIIRDRKIAVKGMSHSLEVQSAQLEEKRVRLRALLGT